MTEHRSRHSPLLGTVVEVVIRGARTRWGAGRLERRVIGEMERLQHIFNAYDPTSELCRWRAGATVRCGPELSAVLALALEWQRVSGGAFNPASGELSARWQRAVAEAVVPSGAELGALAAGIAAPRYEIGPTGTPQLTGDGSAITLNAIAKGWIVDRALSFAAARAPNTDLVVNAGGDLAHLGPGCEVVGIEHPIRSFDNEPPIARIELARAGLATSGRARRGFHVGDRWYSHVIDPRTGEPADATASVSVVAASAALADVGATVAGLMSPSEALAWGERTACAVLVVELDGTMHRNDHWRSIER